jgi:hypothetical protein
MNAQFWKNFGYVFVASQTISVIIMIELILWRIPYLSLFLNLKAAGLIRVGGSPSVHHI